MHQLIDRYGDQKLKANADAIMNSLDVFRPECSLEELARPEHVVDDFEAAGITSKEDVRRSSPVTSTLLRGGRPRRYGLRSRMGVRLRPIFSSDFTHFDVPDFRSDS